MQTAVVSRRMVVAGALAASASAVAPARPRAAYAFRTAEYDVRLTVEFYDEYSSDGFAFRNLAGGSGFCVGRNGYENRGCVSAFFGSLAIARYKFRPRPAIREISGLREHVRTIDLDTRLPDRDTFDRSIEVRNGIASDIQAFGYETSPPYFADRRLAGAPPWYFFRQDLYIDKMSTAFLIVYWKHTATAVRILDVIPGEGTWPQDPIR